MIFSDRLVGNIAMLLYITMTALSSILLHNTIQNIMPQLAAFYTFLFCILVYSFFSFKLVTKIDLIKKHLGMLIVLNITTAICWIFTFYSLESIPAELYLFVYMCSITISSLVFYRKKLLKVLALCLSLAFLASSYSSFINKFEGILLACLGGISGTIYSIYSKKLTPYFSTHEILSLRFHLALVSAFILTLMHGHFEFMSMHYYGQFLILSFISIIIPLILFQIGIKTLHVNVALSYLPFAPLSCYMINSIIGFTSFHLIQLIAVLFITIAMLF